MSEFWKKQKGESRQAYHAFSVYRDLGPTRTLVKAAKEVGKHEVQIRRWSAKWLWVARAEAFDAFMEGERRKELLQQQKEAQEAHANAGKLLQREAWNFYRGEKSKCENATEARQHMKDGAELQRVALGMPKEISEIGVTHGGEVTHTHGDADKQPLTDEERGAAEVLRRRVWAGRAISGGPGIPGD